MKLIKLGFKFILLGLTIIILVSCGSEKTSNPQSESGSTTMTGPQTSQDNVPSTSSQTDSSSVITPKSSLEIKAKSYLGTWIITKYIPTNNVSSLSKKDIDDYIGKRIIVSENQIATSEGIINNPVFDERTVSNREFFENWRIQFNSIGVSEDSVQEVNVSNYENETENGMGSNFIVTNDKKTYTIIGGVLFELEKK